MVQLNYNNLDADTQQQLLSKSKQEIEQRYGKDLKAYAKENGLNSDEVLDEEAIQNMYNYKYTFTI